MISPKFQKYNKDTGLKEEIDLKLLYQSNTIPGTVKFICQKGDDVIQQNDFIYLTIGEKEYYLQVLLVDTDECILVDLLLYNIGVYVDVTNFQELISLLKEYMIFPDNSFIYENINFNLTKGNLLNMLIQCNSNNIIITALDGSLKLLEVTNSISPEPSIVIIENSWSIC